MNRTHYASFSAEVPAYAQLQREMHHALLAQHPEWILPNGESPTCDSYDARFAALLNQTLPARPRRIKPGSSLQFQFEFPYPSRVALAH
jgi:hypothetical protein